MLHESSSLLPKFSPTTKAVSHSISLVSQRPSPSTPKTSGGTDLSIEQSDATNPSSHAHVPKQMTGINIKDDIHLLI